MADSEDFVSDLHSPDREIRRNAVLALGSRSDRRAVELLIAALDDSYVGVRLPAATALGRSGDRRAVEPLIRALHDSYWQVREYAADALSQIGDERAIAPLLAVLGHGGEVNDAAMHALIKMEATCILPRLVAELSHPEEYVRWRAAYGLEKIGDARALPELDRVAQDEKGNIRRDISVTGMAKQAAARIRERMMEG